MVTATATTYNVILTNTAAPEPSALLLLAPGALTVGMVGIRARRRQTA